MRANCPGVEPESYHSLLYWMTYLRTKRAFQGRPLERAVDGVLVQRVWRLHRLWLVDMRYRGGERASESEARMAYDDVGWLRDRYPLLWRR